MQFQVLHFKVFKVNQRHHWPDFSKCQYLEKAYCTVRGKNWQIRTLCVRVSFAAPPSPEEVSYCKIRQKCIARIHFLDSSASTGFGSAGEQTLRLLLVTKGVTKIGFLSMHRKLEGNMGFFRQVETMLAEFIVC